MRLNNRIGRIGYKDIYFINFFIAVVNLSVILMHQNTSNRQVLIPLLIIITSGFLAVRVKESKTLFFLISIITYLNVSIAVLDGFLGGEIFRFYQMELRASIYNLTYMKSILLNITIFSLLLTPNIVKRSAMVNVSINNIKRKSNLVIFIGGIALIILFIVFGYEQNEYETFRASARTIYEYAILLFVIVWYYSGKIRVANVLLAGLAILYIAQGLYYGDRSSSLVMIVLLMMVLIKKIQFKKMVIYALFGIVLANAIAVYRNLSSFNFSYIIKESLNNGVLSVFSDTASASYYTGVAIIATKELVTNSKLEYILQFLVSLIVGSSSEALRDANVTLVAFDYFHVGGGGLYSSYFYFWGGYFGVIIGSVLLGIIVRIVFTSGKTPYILLQYYLTVMAFRWYLYTPYTLFRTTLLMFVLLYLITIFIHKLTTRVSKKNNIRIKNAYYLKD